MNLNILKNSKEILGIGIEKIELDNKDTLNNVLFAMSYYYDISKDIRCIVAFEKICKNINVDINIRIFLYWQLVRISFLNKEILKSINIKEIYDSILDTVNQSSALKEISEIKEKNKQIAVFITNQFLSYEHSPTKILLSMIKSINDKFSEIDEIYIFNSTEMPKISPCSYYKPLVFNHINISDEYFYYLMKLASIDRCEVNYFDDIDETNSLKKIDSMLEEIYNLKPNFIISIGGSNILADMCNNFTDVYTYGTTRDIPIAKSKYLVKSLNTTKIKEILINDKQSIIEMPQGFFGLEDKYDELYTREEFEIPKDLFLISIVGNRLEEELSDKFIDICKDILTKNKNTGIVFIGEYKKEWLKNKLPRDVYNRLYTIGFKNNLISAITLSNMFLNPKRTGGGYSGLAAISCNIPVISINTGDVSELLSDEFKVSSYSEMLDLVNSIIENNDLYISMCDKTKTLSNKYEGRDWDLLINYILQK
jgi:glycosyltransferase involved in cell wall biosynthesis